MPLALARRVFDAMVRGAFQDLETFLGCHALEHYDLSKPKQRRSHVLNKVYKAEAIPSA